MDASMPFAVDRAVSVPLTRQISDGLLSAIETGVYGDGDALPSIREAAAALEVSEIVVRRAYSRLVRDGRVAARRGVGYLAVCGKSVIWRGSVLLVGFGAGENYLSNVLQSVIQKRLTADRYLVTCVNVPRDPSPEDLSAGIDRLLRQKFDLIVSLDDSACTLARLAGRDEPKVVLYNRNRVKGPNVTAVRFCEGAAMAAFAEDCRARGVRKVMQLGFSRGFADASSELAAAGIAVQSKHIRAKPGTDFVGSLMRRTIAFFEKMIVRGRAWLPDVIYFCDDYMATAAVLTLLRNGVRIPEDVRIASWSNVGHGPVLPVPFARIQFDGPAAGELLYRTAVSILCGRPCACREIRTEYIPEEC